MPPEAENSKIAYSIVSGLSSNKSIQKVWLIKFNFGSWNQIELIESSDRPNRRLLYKRNNELRQLMLSTDEIDAEFLPQMMRSFPKLNGLDLVVRTGNQSQDLNCFRRILESCPSVEALYCEMRNVEMSDLQRVCDALKGNSTLKELKIKASAPADKRDIQKSLVGVLRERNVTLETLCLVSTSHPYSHIDIDSSLQYFLDLNKWGRKVARSNHTTKMTFVRMLKKVADTLPEDLTPEERSNVLFGLLRELLAFGLSRRVVPSQCTGADTAFSVCGCCHHRDR